MSTFEKCRTKYKPGIYVEKLARPKVMFVMVILLIMILRRTKNDAKHGNDLLSNKVKI